MRVRLELLTFLTDIGHEADDLGESAFFPDFMLAERNSGSARYDNTPERSNIFEICLAAKFVSRKQCDSVDLHRIPSQLTIALHIQLVLNVFDAFWK
jgi:hypothetical protein